MTTVLDSTSAITNNRSDAPRRSFKTLDGNEAVAHVAYRTSEVIAIYPITPSSPMGEWSDAWSAASIPNLWGTIPTVVEMQSEGGAAGAIHGALQTGSLSTTFTSSQGLLLMIPNMYKIAGELTPAVIHVAARALAAQALSIFGDHSDVMAARQTGFAMLSSNSVQEAIDLALISHAATLETRIPFLHFFDGFRTSHEVSKIEVPSDDVMRAMIRNELVVQHRARALSPDHPAMRGTAQNPDVYFQARESVNRFYAACPGIVQQVMDRYAVLTGRQYSLYEYHGTPDAERLIVIMGSGAEAVHETVDYLTARGEKVGVLKVRLYRPFDVKCFIKAIPKSVRSVAVLDRTKEPGSAGEPLHLDVVLAFSEALANGWISNDQMPRIVGGRYGLSSKEFTPSMTKAVFDNIASNVPKNHFTIGIEDDVTFTSLPFDAHFSIEPDDVVRALFYGLGSDGTVGANKNSIKIIGENTDNYAQGYFVYDSKKAGTQTVSHLRFGPRPIRSTYLVTEANFVACHQPGFIERYDMLRDLVDGGTFLLNAPYGPEEVWNKLPVEVQQQLIAKKAKFYVIDATRVARETGMGSRINTIMQAAFFALSNVLPKDEAIGAIQDAIRKSYASKGNGVVEKNIRAVDQALAHLHRVEIPSNADSPYHIVNAVPDDAPAFVCGVLGMIIGGNGDALPVSALPCDGTYPTATTQYEKRNLALDIPVWETEGCIQCGKCSIVCPHAAIRIKVYEEATLATAPQTFKTTPARDREWTGLGYSIQVAPEDCTGCGICVDICPAKSKSDPARKTLFMQPQPPLRDQEKENWKFFLTIPELDRQKIKNTTIRQQQIQQPLFEFSGACSGCGETPYLKLLTQLYGDRMLVANATGCSSIYGGNLPTTPWATNHDGLGPAWSNSLFEDNAEFGLGFRVSLDKQMEFARELVGRLAPQIGENLAKTILDCEQKDEAEIFEQRGRVKELKDVLRNVDSTDAHQLMSLADALVKKSVWIVGGDGWAYDIGFGGLDHVLASGRNVNIIVLDTEVYSNTGGQMSKSTPRGASAKFATAGKRAGKKDLGLMAMSYGNVYVASVAMGAKDEHTLKAFLEAEAYDGPSIIIAYSHCIAHGMEMATAMQHQKAAVDSGQWLLYRYHPERAAKGETPLLLDSKIGKTNIEDYFKSEVRFAPLFKSKPETREELFTGIRKDVQRRWSLYQQLSSSIQKESAGERAAGATNVEGTETPKAG